MLVIVYFTTFIASSLSQTSWNGLRVTYNPDVNDPDYFVRFPRTESEAYVQGFRMIADCDLTAKWRGKRYVRDEDYSVIMLYDVNGFVAGIQTAITKTPTYPPLKLKPPFIDDGSRSVLTAYFTDPSIICTTGRSVEEITTQGTGTSLYIQNSTSPESSTRMPPTLYDVRRTNWTEAKCIPYMGLHFYYNLTADMSCDEMFPTVLLYNKGNLNAFAWMFLKKFDSKRYEIAPKAIYPRLMYEVPKCVQADYDFITNQHVYLTDDITANKC
ncbi:hypothetical protein BsWGS_01819 [Bradybaena similaris]